MRLRKINAGLSLLCTILLLDHAIFLAAWMLSRGAIANNATPLPWILVWAMAAHAILSILLGILGHKGAEKRKCNSYPKLNAATLFQRIGGILLLIFTIPHVAGASGAMTPPQLVHAVLPPLFFTLALAHVAVSASKAFITLGIGNARFIKVAGIAFQVLCAVTLIADVVGFYLFVY